MAPPRVRLRYHAAMTTSSRAARAAARASWRVERHALTDRDELLTDVSPSTCVAMVWALTLDAWACGGRALPDYDRRQAPGRLLRHGR